MRALAPAPSRKELFSGAPPRCPPACAPPRLLPKGLICLFQFLSSTLLGSPSPRQHAPAATTVGGTGGLGAALGLRRGPGGCSLPARAELEADAPRGGAGAGGAREVPAGEGAAPGPAEDARPRPGPPSLPICRTKAAEAAEMCWRLSTACKQNPTESGERKSEYGAAENGASASGTSFFPPLPLSSSVPPTPLVLQRSAPLLSSLYAPPPVSFSYS